MKNKICLAHKLQLALIAVPTEVTKIHTSFQNWICFVNIVTGSTKHHDELEASRIVELEHLIETGQFDTGIGANQIGILQYPENSRWSLYFKSVFSLIRLYGPTC